MTQTINVPVSPYRRALLTLRRWHWQWPAMAGIALAAIAFGYVGLTRYFAAAGEPRSFWDICYFILYLFVVESGEVAGPVPWQLTVARFLAPVVPAWAIVRAAGIIFREQLQILRMEFTRGHVVVCGLGRQGLEIAKDSCEHGERVVAIEINDENDAVRVCRDLRISVLIGNARDVSLLRRARVHHAKCVVAICGDDGTNVEVAVHTHQLAQTRGVARRGPVRCLVHIVDLQLCVLFRSHRVFAETGDQFEAYIFNTYENIARLLLENQPVDRGRIKADDGREVRLVVIGFAWLGESVLLQAAKTAHFANLRKLQAVVVDLRADELRKDFYKRYPQFDKACAAEFLQGDANDPAILQRICQWAGDPLAVSTIIICLDNDSRSLSCALNLHAELGQSQVPILARMSDDAGLATLLQDGGTSRWATSIRPFGATGSTCARMFLLDEQLDRLARAIHTDYVEQARRQGRAETDPSLQPWERLDQDLRDSNRQQADHIPVKLRAIGCYSAAMTTSQLPVTSFTPEEIELLAKMEHARFNAERFLGGWTCGPKDVQKKTSPHLVPWEELSDEFKDYDRKAVQNIPHLLEMVGQRIYRQASA